ncbi:F0F1 ATP synthase subunit delta, partial [Aliarcobacter butzleri]
MKDLVAKRYVKALIEGRDLKAITDISDKLNEISSAFNSDKFKSIITSPEVNENDKTSLIISL